MDFQNFAESLPKYDLPEELCREILSRLPVKSLLRFCCVSKSWLSLIKCPDFQRLHLQKFKNNHDEDLLVVQGVSQDCVVRCSDTFETNSGTLLTLVSFRRRRCSVVDTTIMCSCDGLVVLRSEGNRLKIWNPSIRKFHDIPALPEIEKSHDILFPESEIGLGYDPFVKDYKYVKTICVNHNQPPLVAVYTLAANSWKIIPFQGKEGFDLGKEGFNFDWVFGSSKLTVCLQGILYFLVYRSNTRHWELGSFDMSNEVFHTVRVPDDTGCRKVYISFFRNGCSSLALFIYDTRIDNLTMWVFESKSMCWTKVYKLGLGVLMPRFLYLKKNRDLLMRKEIFLNQLATNGYLAHDAGLVSSFNLETKEEKILQRKNKKVISEVYHYIESLVLFK